MAKRQSVEPLPSEAIKAEYAPAISAKPTWDQLVHLSPEIAGLIMDVHPYTAQRNLKAARLRMAPTGSVEDTVASFERSSLAQGGAIKTPLFNIMVGNEDRRMGLKLGRVPGSGNGNEGARFQYVAA